MIIAIDGPSGAGKSTIANSVATRLGFSRLDTGAMFRCAALKALNLNIRFTDDAALKKMLSNTDISFKYGKDSPSPTNVILDGKDVTAEIRTYEIDNAVTPVCQQPSVRFFLLKQQRSICAKGNYILDGRDIGTVVFPNAEVKIYLDATPEERARRRMEQNKQSGVGLIDFHKVLTDINRRDYEDTNREFAPLVKAKDAIFIDSTNMTLDEVVNKICDIASRTLAIQ